MKKTNGNSILGGVSVIKECSSGSNATTVLCMDETGVFYRKYAFGGDGEKLYEQIRWIKENNKLIPLPQVIREKKTECGCYYDMVYNSHSVGMFEYVHSMPIEQSWKLITSVLEQMEQKLYSISMQKATPESIHQYYIKKVAENIHRLNKCEMISSLLKYDVLTINGEEYKNLKSYDNLINEFFMRRVFIKDEYSVIHGDLTIENLICTRNDSGEDGVYIIDPNTGNIHDSATLDYAKLLQSLHGEYELIKAVRDIEVKGNNIKFSYTRSQVYRELCKRYIEYLQMNMDQDTVRSIFFHEIIHWLRLIPYQIQKNEMNAVAYYGQMLIILKDIYELYGE